jgi:hypothetical protein
VGRTESRCSKAEARSSPISFPGWPVDEDYRDWLAVADEPIRPHVVVRIMAAVYQCVRIPDESLDPELAAAFASRTALGRKSNVCLVLSRRVSVWFDAAGHDCGRTQAMPEMPCEPYAVIGGKRVQFAFGKEVLPSQIDGPGR